MSIKEMFGKAKANVTNKIYEHNLQRDVEKQEFQKSYKASRLKEAVKAGQRAAKERYNRPSLLDSFIGRKHESHISRRDRHSKHNRGFRL